MWVQSNKGCSCGTREKDAKVFLLYNKGAFPQLAHLFLSFFSICFVPLILWTLPTKILNFSFTMYISWVITRPVFFTKCYDMEVGENRVCVLWYREERRRKTRDIYRRHQPLQP